MTRIQTWFLLFGCALAAAPAMAQPVGGAPSAADSVSARCAETIVDRSGRVQDGRALFRASLPNGEALIDDGRLVLDDKGRSPAVDRYLDAVVDGCKRAISAKWDLESDAPNSDSVVVVRPGDGQPADGPINAALQDPANAGKWIYVPAGRYRLLKPILLKDGARLIADHRAVFHRGWDSPFWDMALIQGVFPRGPNDGVREVCDDAAAPCAVADANSRLPADYPEATAPYRSVITPDGPADAANDVEVIGGTWRGVDLDGARRTGRVAQWYGNRWSLTGLFIASWATDEKPAFGIAWIGNQATLKHVVMRDPAARHGADGIHMLGGADAVVAYADVVSGDDSLAAFTGCRDGAGGECKFSEINIVNSTFRDARVASLTARAIALGLGWRPDRGPGKPASPPLRSFVAGLRYENIEGYSFGWAGGGAFGATITDLGELARSERGSSVRDILIRNVSISGPPENSRLAALNGRRAQPLQCGLKVNAAGTDLAPVRFEGRVRLNGRVVTDDDRGAMCVSGRSARMRLAVDPGL